MKGIKPITKESLKRKKSMHEVMGQQMINSLESETFTAFLCTLNREELVTASRRRSTWGQE